MTRDNDKAVEWLEHLGKLGFIVSVAFGNYRGKGLLYSVDVLDHNGETFNEPIPAISFKQAVLLGYKRLMHDKKLFGFAIPEDILDELKHGKH